MYKIFLILFVFLLVITVVEVGYYLVINTTNPASNKQSSASVPTTEPTSEAVTNKITVAPKQNEIISLNRPNPPDYYGVDKSYIDLFSSMKKGINRNYYVMETDGTVDNFQTTYAKSPDLFCFTLVNEQSQKNCVSKKETKVYTLNSLGEQKIVPYTDLKNGDRITFIDKEDLAKPAANGQSFVEFSILIQNQL